MKIFSHEDEKGISSHIKQHLLVYGVRFSVKIIFFHFHVPNALGSIYAILVVYNLNPTTIGALDGGGGA